MKTLRGKLPKGAFPMGYVKIGRLPVCPKLSAYLKVKNMGDFYHNKIFHLLRRAIKLDIVKVFSFTAMSTLVRMLTGLISVKVVASIIGPAGVALVGQLNNFSSIVLNLSTGGIYNGITKYVAEYKDNNKILKGYLSTAFKIIVCFSLLIGLLLIVFHSYLSRKILLSSDFGEIFVIFGFTILFYALNIGINSVINGYKEFRKFVKVNIAGSIIGLIFTLLLVFLWELKGALISAVAFQSVMIFITLWMIRKMPWVKLDYFKQKFNIGYAKNFFLYSAMTLTSTSLQPLSQILLRGYVISEISPIEAGWWEAMNRISIMYMMVITTSLSVYYLPRLSELTDAKALKNEIFSAYKVIVPCLLGGFFFVYLVRKMVIGILFTPDFMQMESLFLWQLLGDLFKTCCLLLSFLMLAKTMTKMYIFMEFVCSLAFVILGLSFVHYNGVVGITQAYLVSYIIYIIMLSFLFRKLLFNGK